MCSGHAFDVLGIDLEDQRRAGGMLLALLGGTWWSLGGPLGSFGSLGRFLGALGGSGPAGPWPGRVGRPGSRRIKRMKLSPQGPPPMRSAYEHRNQCAHADFEFKNEVVA